MFFIAVAFLALVFFSVVWDWRLLPSVFVFFFGFAYLKGGENRVEKLFGGCVVVGLVIALYFTISVTTFTQTPMALDVSSYLTNT